MQSCKLYSKVFEYFCLECNALGLLQPSPKAQSRLRANECSGVELLQTMISQAIDNECSNVVDCDGQFERMIWTIYTSVLTWSTVCHQTVKVHAGCMTTCKIHSGSTMVAEETTYLGLEPLISQIQHLVISQLLKQLWVLVQTKTLQPAWHICINRHHTETSTPTNASDINRQQSHTVMARQTIRQFVKQIHWWQLQTTKTTWRTCKRHPHPSSALISCHFPFPAQPSLIDWLSMV